MNPYFILIFVVFSSFVFGLIGFGDALIIIPIITPIIGIKNAVIFSNLWGLISATLNSIRYRKHLDKQFLLYTLSMGIIGTILGTLAINIAPVRWIELFLGIFVVCFASLKLFRWFSAKKTSEKLDKKETRYLSNGWIAFGGFSYGFSASLISATGPILVALLDGRGHQRESFIGNFAFICVVTSLIQGSMYIAGGMFPIELFPVFLLSIPIIFVGTKMGQIFTEKIPKDLFQFIILGFLLFIGSRTILNVILFY